MSAVRGAPGQIPRSPWSQWVVATLARSLLLGVCEADFVRGRQFKQIKALIEYSRTDRFSTRSIVRSTGYRVLHRPVELAPFLGTWLRWSSLVPLFPVSRDWMTIDHSANIIINYGLPPFRLHLHMWRMRLGANRLTAGVVCTHSTTEKYVRRM